MKIEEFKLVKNRQNPNLCYGFVKRDGSIKHTIFTMSGGREFLASIEEKDMNGQYRSKFNKNYNTIEDCIDGFNQLRE